MLYVNTMVPANFKIRGMVALINNVCYQHRHRFLELPLKKQYANTAKINQTERINSTVTNTTKQTSPTTMKTLGM